MRLTSCVELIHWNFESLEFYVITHYIKLSGYSRSQRRELGLDFHRGIIDKSNLGPNRKKTIKTWKWYVQLVVGASNDISLNMQFTRLNIDYTESTIKLSMIPILVLCCIVENNETVYISIDSYLNYKSIHVTDNKFKWNKRSSL